MRNDPIFTRFTRTVLVDFPAARYLVPFAHTTTESARESIGCEPSLRPASTSTSRSSGHAERRSSSQSRPRRTRTGSFGAHTTQMDEDRLIEQRPIVSAVTRACRAERI